MNVCTGDWLTTLQCLDTSTGGAFGAILSACLFVILFVVFKSGTNDDAFMIGSFCQAILIVMLWLSGVVGFGVMLFWGIVAMIVAGYHIFSR